MRIIITEEQFRRLIEADTTAPTLDGGDLKEFPGSEVSPTANVTTPDGGVKYGKPMKTGSDRIAKKLSNQNNYVNGKAALSRMA